MSIQKKVSWLARVEEIIEVLKGSTIGELELTEEDTEIVIRRTPAIMASAVSFYGDVEFAVPHQSGTQRAVQTHEGTPIVAPLTGIYYSAASPASPAFVNIGDVVQVGHVVAIVEAMKVFNEVTAETSGRVIAIVATNGNIVQKGDVLLRIAPV